MTKNLSKKNFNKLSKTLDTIFVNILDDMALKYNINPEDLEKHYPKNNKLKKIKKIKKKEINIK